MDYFIQALSNLLNCTVTPRTNMGTWMHSHLRYTKCFCSFNFFSHKLNSKTKVLLFHCIPKINNIRCMDNNIRYINIIFLHKSMSRFDIHIFYSLSTCILRCTRINHKGISAIDNRIFSSS